jgi:integrase
LGKINANPWREVKVLGKPRATAGTGHYTREEIENVHNALLGRTDCQLVMALGYFAGLRIGEIAGLQWGDIDTHIHVRRAIHRRQESQPKTDSSLRSIPLIEPIITLLREHRRTATSTWVFPNEAGKPMDMELLSRRVIRPMLKAAGLSWKGYHATRRGAGTDMMRATKGNLGAVQMFLGHSTATTTARACIKKNPDVLAAGMKALEAASAVRAIETEGDTE